MAAVERRQQQQVAAVERRQQQQLSSGGKQLSFGEAAVTIMDDTSAAQEAIRAICRAARAAAQESDLRIRRRGPVLFLGTVTTRSRSFSSQSENLSDLLLIIASSSSSSIA